MAKQQKPKKLSKSQERRKEDILQASLKVFDRDGFDAARMSDIADEADVAKGTLYLYFDSKAALLEGVIASAIIPTLQAAGGTADSHNGAAADLLAKQMKIMANRMASREMCTLLRYMMSGRSEQHQRIAKFYFENVVQKGLRVLGETIRRGVESGEFKREFGDVNPLALLGSQIYMTVWKGLFDEMSPIDTDRLSNDLVQLVTSGLQRE